MSLFPDLSLFAVMVFFIATYFVVSKFLVAPINGVLEEREHDAQTANETYEQSLTRFNESTAQIEDRLRGARREASKLRDEFRTEAAAHRAGVVEKTSNEARKLVADAEEQLNKDVAAARERIVRESDALARVAAERILGRAV